MIDFLILVLNDVVLLRTFFFRLLTQKLLIRLVRKFGYDVISALVPKEDKTMHKRLNNIRKIESRKKRDSEKRLNMKEDEEDEEDDFGTVGKRKSLKVNTFF